MSEKVRISIIYYSSTGANYELAKVAESVAEKAGAEVRLRKVAELAPPEAIAQNPAWKAHVDATKDVPVATLDDLDWADAYIFSVPTRFGNVPSQMKQFLDMAGPLWAQGKLANKVVTAMSTASNPNGGQEATILSLYTTMYHFGAIVVAPGYTDQAFFAAGGNPYGTSFTATGQNTVDEATKTAVEKQTERVITVTKWLKAGQNQ